MVTVSQKLLNDSRGDVVSLTCKQPDVIWNSLLSTALANSVLHNWVLLRSHAVFTDQLSPYFSSWSLQFLAPSTLRWTYSKIALVFQICSWRKRRLKITQHSEIQQQLQHLNLEWYDEVLGSRNTFQNTSLKKYIQPPKEVIKCKCICTPKKQMEKDRTWF